MVLQHQSLLVYILAPIIVIVMYMGIIRVFHSRQIFEIDIGPCGSRCLML